MASTSRLVVLSCILLLMVRNRLVHLVAPHSLIKTASIGLMSVCVTIFFNCIS